MDPSTTAHIDPNTLYHQSASGNGIPSLGVNSTAIPPPAPGSNNPFAGATGEIDRSHTLKPSVVADDPPSSITSDLKAKEAKVHSTISGTTTSSTSTNSVKPNTSSSNTSSTHVSDTPLATGLRQRVNNLGTQLEHAQEHPAVQNVKGTAQAQVGQFREFLGKSKTIRNLEQRFNVDRVVLVSGAVLAYFLLIPLNLFGLALPTTTLLTLLPPSFLALGILDGNGPSEANEAATRALLAYFVTLGFIQTLESLAAGVLEKRIPQYYTLKLVVLAYLLHPQTQGAMKLHQAVFRPLFIQTKAATSPTNINTPPQSKEAGFHGSSASSPAFNPSGLSGNSLSGNGLSGNQVGEGFTVVTERQYVQTTI